MDYKVNQKYFKGRFANTFSIIAIIFIGLGCVVGIYSMVMWGTIYLGVPFLIVGVILFLVSNSFIVKDEDMENCGERVKDSFIKEFNETNPVLSNFSKARGLTEHSDPVFFGEFYFEGNDFLLHEGKDKKYRTSDYFVSGFLREPDKLYVSKKVVSLTEENSEYFSKAFTYNELESAEFKEIEHDLLKRVVRYKNLILKGMNNEVLAVIPVNEDASSDTLLEKINISIRKSKS